MVVLRDDNPTFGGVDASNFASRVAGGETTEGDGFLDYNEYDQGSCYRNIASLSGEMLADPSDLAGTGNPDVSYKEPNLCDRSTLFTPGCFSTPVIVKSEIILQKM